MAKDTRERILDAALEIFARDGCEGTNLKDIADSVGIVKSALYRHFTGKEDIQRAVFEYITAYYTKHFGSADSLPRIPKTVDELYDMTMRMVDFTIHDKKIIQTRKILHVEQFRDESVRRLASQHFIYDTEKIFAKVFSAMMENGALKKADPDILALSYTAPITALIHLTDREPEKEAEAMEKIRSFVNLFIETYKGE